ncbi:hypothetical protein T4A_5073 [Trichinella pseudospiralis]|uniref:Secreted protein n=1 Tax=Trichinella pseudospiralis TaxID=6337 RepID=A0A0V1F0G7_TRIPS|nr:hypothetical protein T4A_5073 [Trichinella pseudospiralis]
MIFKPSACMSSFCRTLALLRGVTTTVCDTSAEEADISTSLAAFSSETATPFSATSAELLVSASVDTLAGISQLSKWCKTERSCVKILDKERCTGR